jgi:hypothetical protein
MVGVEEKERKRKARSIKDKSIRWIARYNVSDLMKGKA